MPVSAAASVTRLPMGDFDLRTVQASSEVHEQIREQYDDANTQKKVDTLQEKHAELAEIPDEELIALMKYTGSYYRNMNGALRTGKDAADWDEEIVAASSALAQLPGHKGTLYRGATLPREAVDVYEPGNVITERAFMSTSQNPAVADRFGAGRKATAEKVPTKFIIENEGAGKDIDRLSSFDSEDEVLFPPGSRFEVVEKSADPTTGLTTIKLATV